MFDDTIYRSWLSRPDLDAALRRELEAISGVPEEIQSRFQGELQFGTAGLRGLMGAGPNRLNIYTIRLATAGFSELIKQHGQEAARRGVVIAHDSRNNSALFAKEAARVLAAYGITAYLFDDLRPTPELSFSVRSLHCIAGINITASHNPKEYNGYKAYWEDGAQLSPELASLVMSEMRKIDLFAVPVYDFDSARNEQKIHIIGLEQDEAYLSAAASPANPAFSKAHGNKLNIVYTPFHGAGVKLVPELLRRSGFENVLPVPEQMTTDGNFPTVKSPNPSNTEGFSYAVKLASGKNADIIIGTDPDADRVVALAKSTAGQFEAFSGNQMGALLLHYLITVKKEQNCLPVDSTAVKSIVSTYLADEICSSNGVKVVNVLTGFKYIGEKIKEMEEVGNGTFLFGFEESCGYLSGSYARDKDAVASSLLIAEMALYFKERGQSLWDVMRGLYEKHGFYFDRTIDLSFTGLNASGKITSIVTEIRRNPYTEISGLSVKTFADLNAGTITDFETKKTSPAAYPKADVLIFTLKDNSSVIIRPSGTEPKIKIYLFTKHEIEQEAIRKLNTFETDMKNNLK